MTLLQQITLLYLNYDNDFYRLLPRNVLRRRLQNCEKKKLWYGKKLREYGRHNNLQQWYGKKQRWYGKKQKWFCFETSIIKNKDNTYKYYI